MGNSRRLLLAGVCALAAACVPAATAFSGPLALPPRHAGLRRAGVCAMAAMSEAPQAALSRRCVVAAAAASVAGVRRAAADEAEDASGSPDEVVVQGEMRLEVGSDKKLAKFGGKARAEVVLRIVGKGIISKTSEEIELEDFPVCMPDAPSRTVGTQCALSLEQTRCSCVPLP